MEIINKLPENTEITSISGIGTLSLWQGKVCQVISHNYRDYLCNDMFDPNAMTRKYVVRFLIDSSGNFETDLRLVGRNYHVQNPSLPYEKTSWACAGHSVGIYFERRGTFSPANSYFLKLSLTDLFENEAKALGGYLDKMGYIDATNTQVKKADLVRLCKCASFEEFENEVNDYDTCNKIYRWVLNSDSNKLQRITGIYSMDKKCTKIKFVLTRGHLKSHGYV